MKAIETIENQITERRAALDQAIGTPCEVYTRIVGYYRPIDQFNAGRREEQKTRVYYDLKKSEREL